MRGYAIVLPPWGPYLNEDSVCNRDILLVIQIRGPVCHVKLARW